MILGVNIALRREERDAGAVCLELLLPRML